jgi:serine/threonine protein phosphatase PrpC
MEWWTLYGQYLGLAAVLFLLAGLMICRHRLSVVPERPDELEIGEENAIGGREAQEDASGAAQTDWGTLAVVADGIGKGQAGKHAALMAVRAFLRLFTSQNVAGNISYFFNQAFTQSNRDILEHLQGTKGGAAVAAALIHHGFLYYASVGDVRIALLREEELIPVNEGHTMKTAAVRGFVNGRLSQEQALAISREERQMNYVGRDGFRNAEIGKEPIALVQGDVILVMTDGIYKCFTWLELENLIKCPASAQKLAEQIIEEFNRKTMQDKDNASLFVLRYNGV